MNEATQAVCLTEYGIIVKEQKSIKGHYAKMSIIIKDTPTEKYKVAADLVPLLRLIGSVHLDPANAREGHDIAGIAASLNKYGQRTPLVVNSDNTIEKGNGTVEAARSLGWTHIAVVGVDDEPIVATGYSLADNELGDKSQFNLDRLHALMESLPEPEKVPGFDEERLEEIRAMVGMDDEGSEVTDVTPQIDKAAELQEKWSVAEGDIWQAGPHYVICGDCREPDTWRRLLAKSGHEKVNGVFTSPPYAEQRKKQYGGTPADEYVEWWDAVQENIRGNLADDGSFFVNIKPHCEDGERVLYVFDLVLAMKRRWGWRFVDELCWLGNVVPISIDGRFKNGFEPVFHFALGSVKFRPDSVSIHSENVPYTPPSGSVHLDGPGGNVTVSSYVQSGLARPNNIIKCRGGDGYHAAAFPVRLPDFFIRAYSDPGDVWLDPFCGSGTVLVACDNNERVGLGIEKLPKYCAVILERLQGKGLSVSRIC